MGVQLVDFYKQATSEFGVTGRVKLAMLTKVSSEKAQSEPDSAEAIKLFQKSLDQLRNQSGR